jgi:diguanylate cyclase (GGDEF)-like protein
MRCFLNRFWSLPFRLLMAAWCLAMAVAAQAASGPALELDATGASPTNLTPWFGLLEDPEGRLSLEQVRSPERHDRFVPSGDRGDALNFGITPSVWWLRLRLTNGSNARIERLLEVAYPRLSHLNFYAPVADGSYRVIETGTTAPFESRGYPNRHFVFPVALAPHAEQTLYLRVASTTAFIVPARLWTPSAFHAHERIDYAAQAWYFGMAAAMVLYNLLLFIRLKDVLYAQYVGFALSMAFALAAQNGLVKEVFRLQSPLWSDLCTTFGYSFALASGMLFLRRMVAAPRLLPRLDPWLRGFIAFFFVSPLLFLVTGQTLIRAAAVSYLLAMLAMIGLAVYSAWRRERSAYFFLAAFTLLGLGAATNALRAMGLLPTNVLTANAMQVGSALEMLLLALALADRFNQMRRERAAMQTELLAAQNALIETLRSNEQHLAEHVAERTAALENANRRLEALSRTDGLTGIANRRRFDEALASEWARSQRSGEPLALAMLDIDWFKAYNDHFGHLAGDDCLRSVASVLTACAVRGTDLVARYGGEEFAVISPGSTAEQMQRLALEIQRELAALALPHPTTPSGHVTLCAGVAAVTASPGQTPDHLVAAADQALYQAKATGRNRVVVVRQEI